MRPARPTAAAREVAAGSTSARSRPTASMNMALWEDRSTPHSIAPPSKPRNHTEIPERIRPELHSLGWFRFLGGVFRWNGAGGVVVVGH